MKTKYIFILILTTLLFSSASNAQKKRKTPPKNAITTATTTQNKDNKNLNLSADELWIKFKEAIEEDCKKDAIYYVKLAAEKGNEFASLILGEAYYFASDNLDLDFPVISVRDSTKDIIFRYKPSDFGINKPDYDKAIYYIKNYIDSCSTYFYDHDYSYEYDIIGFSYYKKSDYKSSLYWEKKSAEKGYSIGMKHYGNMLLNGEGCAVNPEEGIKWLKKAADKNDCPSCFLLGDYYYFKTEDTSKAVFWLQELIKRAKQQGFEDTSYYSRSHYLLSFCYNAGEGVAEDDDKAFFYIKKAYDLEQDNPEYMFWLAKYYKEGIGVEKSSKKAIELFNKVLESKKSSNDQKEKAKDELNSLIH